MRILLLFFLVSLVGCVTKTNEANVEVKGVCYARLFSLVQKKGYKELIIKNPKTLKIESRYALISRHTEVLVPKNYKKIEVPVHNMAALSTSFVGMLDAIDGLDVIQATTDKKYIANKKLLKKIEAGKVLTAGYETELSPEALLKAKIPLIVFSGFGLPFPNEDKLAQLGIVCLANYDWEEKNPLGKAEWIKVFGALLDKDEEAGAYFDEVTESYLAIKKEASKIKSNQRVICGGLVGDVWYAPAGESFMAGIMEDAGLNYFYKNTKGTASVTPTFEQVFVDDKQCDIWINAEAPSFKKLFELNDKFQHFHTVQRGKVFGYMHDPNYYWEYSPVNPHWLLEDFMHIAQGDTQANLHFYKQLH